MPKVLGIANALQFCFPPRYQWVFWIWIEVFSYPVICISLWCFFSGKRHQSNCVTKQQSYSEQITQSVRESAVCPALTIWCYIFLRLPLNVWWTTLYEYLKWSEIIGRIRTTHSKSDEITKLQRSGYEVHYWTPDRLTMQKNSKCLKLEKTREKLNISTSYGDGETKLRVIHVFFCW